MLYSSLVLSLWLAAAVATGMPVNDTESTPQEKQEVVHCFCNLLQCITSGYMCKSQGKGCFSDLHSNMDVDRALHGCLDLLPNEKHGDCRNVPEDRLKENAGESSAGRRIPQEPDSTTPPASLLLCCHHDMCNHIDSQETRNKYNETILAVGGMMGSEGVVELSDVEGDWRGGYENMRWLKVATIAVPICGALILLVLIALALKILSHETLQHTPLAIKLRGKHQDGQMFADGLGLGMGSGFAREAEGRGGAEERGARAEKKLLPLLGEGEPEQTKNEAFARINWALGGDRAALLALEVLAPSSPSKNTTTSNLLYGHHQYPYPPVLTLGQPDKLDYKRILPTQQLPAYR